jgi:prohibitin 2
LHGRPCTTFSFLQAEQEKQQKIVDAEGEEQSARLVGAMIKDNPAYLNLEKIKAAKEIATIVAQSQNRVYLNSSSLLLDVNNALISAADLKGANKAKGW